MDRIQVIGCSAAGKSTVARALGEIFGIEVTHLDREMWRPGCQLRPPEEEPGVVEKILERRRWVIDGNYTVTLPNRLREAELVVLVDFPRWLCLLRALKRVVMYFGRSRPDMGEGCPERVNMSFLRWIWRYPYDERPELLRQLKAHAPHARIVWLRGHRQMERWLERLRRERARECAAPPTEGGGGAVTFTGRRRHYPAPHRFRGF